MKSFSPIFLLVFLLAGLGSKATPSVSSPAGSDSPLVIHPFQTSPHASENSTPPHPNPESPRTASPEPSPHKFTQTPNLDLQESPHLEYPETLKPTSLNTSISEPLETPKSKPSQRTHPEPSETPKPDPTEIPHPESPEIPKPNPAKTSHPEFPETLNPDPTQIPHQESQHVSKLNSTEISHAEALETPSPETHDPNTETQNSEFLQTFHPDPTQTPDPESHVTHNAHLTEIPHTELPIIHYQDATEIPMASDSEISISLHPKTPASFKDQATALNGLPLNTEPETLVTTQPDSLKLPTSDSLGTIEPEASQNSNPKGPDTPPPSARIAGSPAPPGPLNQSDPATARHPPRRSRGERVNTIIVVERLEETGVTLVGRPEGAAGGALCLFFAGTGLLLGVFLLLWCLYRRATRHRPFAHHRLPNDGDEPVMHVDAPKEPYDLYLYAPDAWIPSHIATKQPLPTPPLPPKLPPPPRGGRPQRLELLSPSSLPNNFV